MEIEPSLLTDHYKGIYNELEQTDESKILEIMQGTLVDKYANVVKQTIGTTVVPRFNEPRLNEFLDSTNKLLPPGLCLILLSVFIFRFNEPSI